MIGQSLISPWTVAAALRRLGPTSMEALAVYLNGGNHGGFDPTDVAIAVNAMYEEGRVVFLSECLGQRRVPFWVALVPPFPPLVPFDAFDHLTLWQASRTQALRAKYPDHVVATGKIARTLGCDVERLRAFMGRNPRPLGATV